MSSETSGSKLNYIVKSEDENERDINGTYVGNKAYTLRVAQHYVVRVRMELDSLE